MNELINLLAQQEENLNSLLVVITDYQKALIAGDLPNMELFLDIEQKRLASIQSNLETQQNLIKNISERNNLNLSSFSIKKLVDVLPSGAKETIKLNKIMKSLKILAGQITEKNRLNGLLINQSRNFIKELIISIIHNNKNLLDRKI
jgi:flagellar biosynthesis/type III secretory pathway chaperone